MAEVFVIWAPTSCIPSPESPQKRTTTVSRFSSFLPFLEVGASAVTVDIAVQLLVGGGNRFSISGRGVGNCRAWRPKVNVHSGLPCESLRPCPPAPAEKFPGHRRRECHSQWDEHPYVVSTPQTLCQLCRAFRLQQ